LIGLCDDSSIKEELKKLKGYFEKYSPKFRTIILAGNPKQLTELFLSEIS